jgi:ATP-dependent Clp protease protease subunit
MNAPSLNELLQNYSANRLQLQAEGIYYLRDVDEETAERYSRDMLLMALAREGRPESPITVYVNSPGGSVGAGFAMMEIAHRVLHIHRVPINTVITGYAYSMAAVIAQVASHRSMGSMSMMMIHSSSWSLSGEDSKIFRDYHKLAEHYQELVSSVFASRTAHQSKTWWKRFIYSGHDRFLDAAECLKLGLVDEVLAYPDDPAQHQSRVFNR